MHTIPFKDHFSPVAGHYADHRPTYPAALFDWIAQQCPQHELAWDCGTGSGQAAQGLAEHFAQVIATDASAAQIAQTTPDAHIHYRVAPAHRSGLEDQQADLVTVAQALHWFDLDAFYTEAIRVLKPAGIIAVWSYGITTVADDPTINALIQSFYQHEIHTYWPPERKHVETRYQHIAFPFQRITPPDLAMSAHWNLPQLTGYLRSWSATGRFIQLNGFDPVCALEEKLKTCWGPATALHQIEWPLTLLVGHR